MDRTRKKRESKETQHYTRHGTNKPLYSIHTCDWRLFMWFASLEKIENLINLFILVWDATEISRQFEEEFSDEINQLIDFLKEFSKETYHKTLIDYRDCRLNKDKKLRELRANLVNNAWIDLEHNGLKDYSHAVEDQLKTCKPFQRLDLRNMVFSRMESFHSFANHIKKSKEETEQENIKNLRKEIMSLRERDKSLEEENTNLSLEIEKVREKLSEKEEKIVNLETEIKEQLYGGKLKQENKNVKLVVELGDAEWRDDDENNSMQLVKDIENLNRTLNKITGVKRNVKEIKTKAVEGLFSSLGCTDVESGRMKLVLEAALQQHLIKFILNSAQDYFNNISEEQENAHITEDKLEAAILSKTEELIKLTTRFEESHRKTDEHSQILPTMLRQQSYAALGNRGFSIDHPFIKKLAKDLTDEMNKYRIIESEEKSKKFEKEIIKIIIQVIRIFYFRLKTQEPILLMKFYKSGESIDPEFMEGSWEGYYEDHKVEICSFPVVFVESDERIYNKAQIIVS